MQTSPREASFKPGRKAASDRKPGKPRSGDIIDGRFQIVGRPLGKGGMGTVYRVQDASGVQYALKRLDPALREEKRFEKRFRLEYEAAAQLEHPNITAYHELFEADGALHIRMELVEGIDLRKLLKQEKVFPIPVATGIARALARALEELHRQRVVHRDLKPENILLGLDGAIKLSDFGISRVEYASMTRTGTLLGTPRYMSPEQLAGKKGEQIGPESDLYSLGMVLYEMICGKDPYRLRKKAEILEVINVKNQKTARPLPSETDPRLNEWLMSMLDKEPDKRPASARLIGEELGTWASPTRELRQILKQWVSQHGGQAWLGSPKKKGDSFWKEPKNPLETQVPELDVSPTQGRELLPAFLATMVFLGLLWGVGFWLQRGGKVSKRGVPPGWEQQAFSPSKRQKPKHRRVEVNLPQHSFPSGSGQIDLSGRRAQASARGLVALRKSHRKRRKGLRARHRRRNRRRLRKKRRRLRRRRPRRRVRRRRRNRRRNRRNH